ncbi:MAG: hypothetical protein R3F11_06670 [Verrucomicrobiales bacterium]
MPDAADFERRVLAVGGIASLHHLHSWSIDGERHVLSAHLVLHGRDVDAAAIKGASARDRSQDLRPHHDRNRAGLAKNA